LDSSDCGDEFIPGPSKDEMQLELMNDEITKAGINGGATLIGLLLSYSTNIMANSTDFGCRSTINVTIIRKMNSLPSLIAHVPATLTYIF